jgi:hypothetical protein
VSIAAPRPARDPRRDPYTRGDGYAEATAVHPDPDSETGWLCPGCGANTVVFYGQGPEFKNKRYRPGTDTRRCADCFASGVGT